MTRRYFFTIEADHGQGYRNVRVKPVLSITTAGRIADSMRKKEGVIGVQIQRYNRDTGEHLGTIAWFKRYCRAKT
jgi:hypothetical protein